MVHLDVEDFSEELLRCLLCHKEPAPRIQSPLLGAFCLLLAGSLWHKGAYNRTFPCMEANYPYVIKNQRGASKKHLVGGFGCDELVLYGIWDTIATPRKSPRHRDGPHWVWYSSLGVLCLCSTFYLWSEEISEAAAHCFSLWRMRPNRAVATFRRSGIRNIQLNGWLSSFEKV